MEALRYSLNTGIYTSQASLSRNSVSRYQQHNKMKTQRRTCQPGSTSNIRGRVVITLMASSYTCMQQKWNGKASIFVISAVTQGLINHRSNMGTSNNLIKKKWCNIFLNLHFIKVIANSDRRHGLGFDWNHEASLVRGMKTPHRLQFKNLKFWIRL